MAKTRTFWDDPKYQRMLVELVAKELSATEIAAQMTAHFGFTFTRNSIIGRTSRKGIIMSQPGKLKRIRKERGSVLTEWNKNPENNAIRLEKLRAYYTKTG